MRSRTVREGSVGLLFLLGIGLFAALVLWLRGTYFGTRTYKAIVEFANAAGMQVGTPVRYRGVAVGKVSNIKPQANGVEVEIEITQSDLAIPRDVVVEANQSGLISENTIDIVPINTVPVDVRGANPFAPDCKDRNLIICNNERLQGRVGISLDELIRVAVRFANLYSDPKFFENINSAVANTSVAAQGVTQLTRELSGLIVSVKQDLRNVSAAANAVGATAQKLGTTVDRFGGTADRLNQTIAKFGNTADNVNLTIAKFGGTADKLNQTADRFAGTAGQINVAVNQTTDRIGATADKLGRTTDRIGTTIDKFGRTADQVSVAVNRIDATATRTANQINETVTQTAGKFDTTADRFSVTAGQASDLLTNINSLVKTNQAALVNTLNNLSQTSEQLRVTVANLSPAIDRVLQGEFIRNLETLSANAAQASANLRDISNSLNDPNYLLTLQQTLDSARVTFENAQKITSDLDELTGDPRFRNNLRNLVNELSGLVSSTEQLQEQVEVAQFLTPMASATNMQIPEMANHTSATHPPVPVTTSIEESKPKPIAQKDSKSSGNKVLKK
ncbi:MlaD family protein [Aerosakkonema sp. BLCC-F183]|uniref:MlaD family protein n=1 Tax=Aerosakkonema sp. BLCC-F183 TaxID=3342834 RepID=UPI0035B75F5B